MVVYKMSKGAEVRAKVFSYWMIKILCTDVQNAHLDVPNLSRNKNSSKYDNTPAHDIPSYVRA